MEKLRVGVWLTENYNPNQGGGFTYYSAIVESISKTKFTSSDIFFIGNHTVKTPKIGFYDYFKLELPPHENGFFLKLLKKIGGDILHLTSVRNYFKKLDRKRYLEIHKICDVIYYPIPMCKYSYFPFIYTLFDSAHLSTWAFPELCSDGQFEARKELYDFVLFKALMVLCESETGKREAIQYLNINEDRLRVLPLIPSGVIAKNLSPKQPTGLDKDTQFIHYPAQFWAHKNHYNLVMAFGKISKKYPDLRLIFTGSDKGNKEYIFEIVKKQNLENKVIDLGFVSLEELKWLYQHSKGLFMPSMLGPSNMPPLEALALGCPVAVSDLPGHREQLGQNAVYFDPLNIDEIAASIEKLMDGKYFWALSGYPSLEANMLKLDKYFEELKAVRQIWA
jgi:glycosyltransferase involved in cell wall biosynthesis